MVAVPINVRELIDLYLEMGHSQEEAVQLAKEELADRRTQGQKSAIEYAKQPKSGKFSNGR